MEWREKFNVGWLFFIDFINKPERLVMCGAPTPPLFSSLPFFIELFNEKKESRLMRESRVGLLVFSLISSIKAEDNQWNQIEKIWWNWVGWRRWAPPHNPQQQQTQPTPPIKDCWNCFSFVDCCWFWCCASFHSINFPFLSFCLLLCAEQCGSCRP